MRRVILVVALVSAVGLTLGAQSPSRAPAVTYSKDVATIIHAKCINCHRPGEVAPMSLRTFDEVRPWARSIKQKVTSREMPPWFADPAHGTFANDARLTDAQIDTIARWVDAGAPRGNPAEEPKLPALPNGWQLGEPDYIITMPLVNIPAEGRDYFPTPNMTIDLPEDRWIRALEIRPSNREVTHHSVFFLTGAAGAAGAAGSSGSSGSAGSAGSTTAQTAGLAPQSSAGSQGATAAPNAGLRNLAAAVGTSGFFEVLGVWAVGTPPTVYPEGSGRWVRKGQQLRSNLHYHPNGKPATDQTRIGLYFGKGDMKKEVASALAGDLTFQIPPGAMNHEMRAVYVVDQDINVVSYLPHMHLRGRDMTMTATLPGGEKRTLLSVPKYDFNWQLFYYPKDRVTLPRGTRVDLVAHFDNSADNPNNPDPTSAVTFGEQSNDEMMLGLIEFTAAEGVSPRPGTPESRVDALLASLPRESSYKVPVTIIPLRPPVLSVLHLPRQGEGTWYIAQSRLQINVIPIRDVVWNGDNYSFRVDVRFGPRAAFTFDVNGTATGDAIRGAVTPVGVAQAPFGQTFEGTRSSLR